MWRTQPVKSLKKSVTPSVLSNKRLFAYPAEMNKPQHHMELCFWTPGEGTEGFSNDKNSPFSLQLPPVGVLFTPSDSAGSPVLLLLVVC